MRCCKCKKDLLETEFYPSKTNMRGYHWECKLCRADMQRSYQKRNKEHIRKAAKAYYDANKEKMSLYSRRKRLKEKYGITLEQYDEMREAQKGGCAICKIPIKKPHIDHNHKTGKVRGLLCWICNTRLGVIENKQFHDAAEAYLEQYK